MICQHMSFWNYLHICKRPLLKPDADVFNGARDLNCDPSLHLHPIFVYASSTGSDESMHMSRLTRAFVVRRCDKYSTDKLVPCFRLNSR